MATQRTIREPFTEREITENALKFEILTLKRERDYAIDAAAHFAHCRWCGEDGIREDTCREGYEYAVKLGIYVPDTEAT